MKAPDDERLPPDEIEKLRYDQELLETWTNEQLGVRPTLDDIMPSRFILERWGNFYMQRDPDEEWSEDERWKLQAAYRWRDIEKALKEEDIDALTRLIIHEEDWIKYVLEKLMRGPGRARGEPRPGDLPDDTRMYLRYAAVDVIRIRDIWERRLR